MTGSIWQRVSVHWQTYNTEWLLHHFLTLLRYCARLFFFTITTTCSRWLSTIWIAFTDKWNDEYTHEDDIQSIFLILKRQTIILTRARYGNSFSIRCCSLIRQSVTLVVRQHVRYKMSTDDTEQMEYKTFFFLSIMHAFLCSYHTSPMMSDAFTPLITIHQGIFRMIMTRNCLIYQQWPRHRPPHCHVRLDAGARRKRLGDMLINVCICAQWNDLSVIIINIRHLQFSGHCTLSSTSDDDVKEVSDFHEQVVMTRLIRHHTLAWIILILFEWLHVFKIRQVSLGRPVSLTHLLMMMLNVIEMSDTNWSALSDMDTTQVLEIRSLHSSNSNERDMCEKTDMNRSWIAEGIFRIVEK